MSKIREEESTNLFRRSTWIGVELMKERKKDNQVALQGE